MRRNFQARTTIEPLPSSRRLLITMWWTQRETMTNQYHRELLIDTVADVRCAGFVVLSLTWKPK